MNGRVFAFSSHLVTAENFAETGNVPMPGTSPSHLDRFRRAEALPTPSDGVSIGI